MPPKGSHLSEEAKKKLRISAKEQFKNGFPEETKRKLRLARIGRKPMLGKKHSLKTIKLFCSQRKKWWDDPEFRKKSLSNRIKLFGSLNPAWRGGITPMVMRLRQSIPYRLWRASVYKKDKFTCQLCGYAHKKGKKRKILDADHIIPFSFLVRKIPQGLNFYERAIQFSPLWDLENGRVLCRGCHKKTDTFLNRWHKKFYELK